MPQAIPSMTDTMHISTLCCDARTRKVFEIFFRRMCDGKFCLTDSHERADVTIIDMDIYDAAEKHIEFRRSFRGQPLVTLSTSKTIPQAAHTYSLKKPLDHEHLKKLLLKIRKELGRCIADPINKQQATVAQTKITPALAPRAPSSASNHAGRLLGDEKTHQFVGKHEDIDTSNATEAKSALYNPSRMLQGSVSDAIKLAVDKNRVIELVAFGIGIIIDPHTLKVYTVVSDYVLRPLCMLESTKKPQFNELASISDNLYTKSSKPDAPLIERDIEAFLWIITLWSSRGRVPKGTNFENKVFLSQWPNLTRLKMIPHALQMSALLAQKPRKLSKISEELGLPQRFVFAFYSACKSLGIAGECNRQSDYIFEEIPDQNDPSKTLESTSSLMKKIISRLTRRNSSDHRNSA